MNHTKLFFKRAAALTFSLLLTASALTSCGGASSTASSGTSSASGGGTTAAPAASAPETQASPAKEPTVVKVGFNAIQVPACYVDADGNLAGDNYEVMSLVDDLLEDYVFEYEPVQADVILAGLDAGTYAFGISNFFYNDERAEKYLFPKYPVSAGLRGLILPTRLKDNFTSGTSDEILGQFAAQRTWPPPSVTSRPAGMMAASSSRATTPLSMKRWTPTAKPSSWALPTAPLPPGLFLPRGRRSWWKPWTAR